MFTPPPIFTRFFRLFSLGNKRQQPVPVRRTQLHVEQLESRDCPTTAPVIGSVVFDHANPLTNDMLIANVQNATDAENDPISFTYAWSVNGNVVQTITTSDLSDSLDLSQTGFGNRGEAISLTVTPFDANDTGDAHTITTVVANTVPVIANNLTFYDSTPGTNDTLMVMVNDASDADGDTVSYTYVWSVNGTVVQTHSSEMMTDELHLDNPGFGDKGDIVSVTITPFNNIGTIDYGDPLTIWTVVGNTAPVIDTSNLSSLQSFTGDAVELQVNATDADGDTITYSLTGSLSAGLSMSSTGLIAGTISASANTTTPYSVTVVATDGTGSDTATFDWTIVPAYAVVVQGDQHSIAGESVELSLSSWKLDNHTLTFSQTGLPNGLEIDTETGTITGTIAYGEESTTPYSVTITATDSAGGVSEDVTFDWYVDAPEVLAFDIGDLESIVGATVEVTIEAWSTEGGTVTFSQVGLPPGLDIDDETGVITGTIDSNADVNSPYAVTITAENAAACISTDITFSWAVRQLVLRVPEDQANLIGDTVSLTPVTPYAGSGTLSFSMSGEPDGLHINTATGEIYGTIASTAAATTPYAITVTATDSTFTASKTFNWDVKEVILNHPGRQFGFEEGTFSVTLTSSAIYGHSIEYDAIGLPTGLEIDIETGVISGTIDAGASANGPYTVTIMVTDTTLNVSDSKTVTWFVDLQLPNIPQQPQQSDLFTGPMAFAPTPRAVGQGYFAYLQQLYIEVNTYQAAMFSSIVAAEDQIEYNSGIISALIVGNPTGFGALGGYQQAVNRLHSAIRVLPIAELRFQQIDVLRLYIELEFVEPPTY